MKKSKMSILLVLLFTILLGQVWSAEIRLKNGLVIQGVFMQAKKNKVYIEYGDTLFVIHPSVISNFSQDSVNIEISKLIEMEGETINFNSYKEFVRISKSSLFSESVVRAVIASNEAGNVGLAPPPLINHKLVVKKTKYLATRPFSLLRLSIGLEYGVRNLSKSSETRIAVNAMPKLENPTLLGGGLTSWYSAYMGKRNYFNEKTRSAYLGYGLGAAFIEQVYTKTFLWIDLPPKQSEEFYFLGPYTEVGYTGHPGENSITHLNILLMPSVMYQRGESTGGEIERAFRLYPSVSFSFGIFIK
jgi:hypothetical protein